MGLFVVGMVFESIVKRNDIVGKGTVPVGTALRRNEWSVACKDIPALGGHTR